MRGTPLDQRGEALGRRIAHAAEQKLRTGDAQRMGHQDFGVEAGSIAGFRKA
ncbi:hypothetical protein BV97_05705 [Novosphingobium resinovorum]|uniref:Uncharacterized protein n=1 Tax=Novosphingobium resinovorum TaxID=158500 RepID=A0A031J2D5_9SPHN|nr:hypothetical protein BV97_05705 [Novosphingobium resinovorum]